MMINVMGREGRRIERDEKKKIPDASQELACFGQTMVQPIRGSPSGDSPGGTGSSSSVVKSSQLSGTTRSGEGSRLMGTARHDTQPKLHHDSLPRRG